MEFLHEGHEKACFFLQVEDRIDEFRDPHAETPCSFDRFRDKGLRKDFTAEPAFKRFFKIEFPREGRGIPENR